MSLFKFKKTKKKTKAPINHFSANAITRRTQTVRKRADDFMKLPKPVAEATIKVQLIYPFLEEFGWKSSDPNTMKLEVLAGGHNKADIMLLKDGVVKIVIEAKAIGMNLRDPKYIEQLCGYFENCYASIGIITDGVEYHFYSYAADDENTMDNSPFAIVDIRRLRLSEKNKFMLYLSRPNLDIDSLIRLSRAKFTYKKFGMRKNTKLDVKNRNVRDSFIHDFPSCTPQEIDELIEFANYHRKLAR